MNSGSACYTINIVHGNENKGLKTTNIKFKGQTCFEYKSPFTVWIYIYGERDKEREGDEDKDREIRGYSMQLNWHRTA